VEKAALAEFVGLVAKFRKALAALEKATGLHDDDPMAHARIIKTRVRPAMAEVRTLADQLETQVAADLWPLPSYREMLMLK
jgi:glutamine synthetase